jgi:ATP-binding cassette subfamily C protein
MSSVLAERRLRGDSPVRLEFDGPAWEVRAGSAQVFAVLEPAGAGPDRIPLFRLGPGDWAFPGPGASGRFVLVALEEDTRLAPRVLDAGALPAASRSEVGRALESWLERLTEVVQEPSPADGMSLPAEGAVAIEEGGVVWPDSRFTWLTSAAGATALSLFGDASLEAAGDGAVLPLPTPAWLAAARATSVEILSGADALAGAAWWAGVTAYQRAIMRRLAALASARRAAEAQALERRCAADDDLSGRLYRRLGAVVDPALLGLRATTDVPPGVPPALAVVAAAAGVRLRPPRAAPPGEGLDQVDALSRASNIRSRRVALEGRWWRQDLGPMLGERVADRRPGLLGRHVNSGHRPSSRRRTPGA